MEAPYKWHIKSTCTHTNTQTRMGLHKDGATRQPRLQCLDCGTARGSWLSKSIECPPWDHELEDSIETSFNEAHKQWLESLKTDREQIKKDYQLRYQIYLESRVWKEKRAKVLERCNKICEACLERAATEVHHTEYPEILGTEPLWTLRGICRPCHAQIHGKLEAENEPY
jgi:hypothetical protein